MTVTMGVGVGGPEELEVLCVCEAVTLNSDPTR